MIIAPFTRGDLTYKHMTPLADGDGTHLLYESSSIFLNVYLESLIRRNNIIKIIKNTFSKNLYEKYIFIFYDISWHLNVAEFGWLLMFHNEEILQDIIVLKLI